MGYDEGLAGRVRELLATEPDRAEKKMFGGLATLLGGTMAVGVFGDGLLVRTPPDDRAAWLAEPGVREFAFADRPMKAFLLVDHDHCGTARELRRWVRRGVAAAKAEHPQ